MKAMKKLTNIILSINLILLILIIVRPTYAEESFDLKSDEKSQLNIAIQFNEVTDAEAVTIMNRLNDWYGKSGIFPACELTAKRTAIPYPTDSYAYYSGRSTYHIIEHPYDGRSYNSTTVRDSYSYTYNQDDDSDVLFSFTWDDREYEVSQINDRDIIIKRIK